MAAQFNLEPAQSCVDRLRRPPPKHRAVAQMAELVDAPASGAGARKGVEVRVLFWAPPILQRGSLRRETGQKWPVFCCLEPVLPVLGRSLTAGRNTGLPRRASGQLGKKLRAFQNTLADSGETSPNAAALPMCGPRKVSRKNNTQGGNGMFARSIKTLVCLAGASFWRLCRHMHRPS